MGPRYLARKVVQAIITIVFVVLLNFVLFRLMPGAPERALLRNPHLTQQAIDAVKAKWGLDKPLFPIEVSFAPPSIALNPESQLVSYLESTAAGDFGYSFQYRGESVIDVIEASFWPTIILIGLAEVIAIFVGLTLGAQAGWKRGGLARPGRQRDQPDPLLDALLRDRHAAHPHLRGRARLVPDVGDALARRATYASPIDQLLDFIHHLVLPLATVSLGLIGGYSILMRSSIIDTRSEDYVTTARAKGLTDRTVLRSHAFPNALLPTVTVIAINLGYVVAGAITAEIVFNWPGLGTLTVDALAARDYPVLQGIFLLISVAVILANLGADLVYGRLDPRVRA